MSGPSGVGKGTICKKVLEADRNMRFSVSMTTRAPREGEVDGVDYHFVSTERFEELLHGGGLLEHNKFVDNYYGTPRGPVMEWIADDHDVLLEIDYHGAFQVRDAYPDAVLIFIAPPSAGELKNRLIGRGSETEESLRLRLNQAKKEAQYMSRYDFILVNDEVDDCVSRIHNLIAASRLRTSLQEDFIRTITEEVNEL